MTDFARWTMLLMLVTLGLARISAAGATTLSIDFAGTFELYDCFGCQPNGLSALVGTSFTGSVSFPASAAEATSTVLLDPSPFGTNSYDAHSVRADYRFAPGRAHFRVDTALDVFDFDGSVEPIVLVQNCTGLACPGKDDFLWILVETPNLLSALYVGGAGWFEDVGVPPLALLQSLSSLIYFDIETPDSRAAVSTSFDFPSPLRVSISSDLTPVPLPGCAPCFVLGLLATAWRARSAERIRRE